MKIRLFILIILAVAGLLDAAFLTYEHYTTLVAPCPSHAWFNNCGKVLSSEYSVILGVPLALLGVVYYSFIFIILLSLLISNRRLPRYLVLLLTPFGFLASMYFVYLQLAIIQAICWYCMLSAVISTILFVQTYSVFRHERHKLIIEIIAFLYRNILKKIFFLLNPESVHNVMTERGELLGKYTFTKKITSAVFNSRYASLEQKIHGIQFKNPIGLSAGFDYEGKLTQILSDVGFGFQAVGTITNMPYGGNPKPMLGRLPKSKSLMVNKGFKNPGSDAMVEKLTGLQFQIPVGISIGRTNMLSLKTQKDSIADIVQAFTRFEASKVKHLYYELNISCPNLFGDITFYPPKNLKDLLDEIQKLHLKKPVFVKMPIEKSDVDVLKMLEVINDYHIAGVIFGNLQKDRNDPAFNQDEVKKFPKGNFSGKPTYIRSNELIALCYKHYQKRFTIIGCGGVFNAADAYHKITLGSSLIQLITGMIYQGPQLIAQIKLDLAEQLKKDGFKNISEAIGSAYKK